MLDQAYERGNRFLYYFCSGCGTRLMHTEGTREVFVKGRCVEGLTKDMLKKAVHIWARSAIVDVSEDVEQYEQDYPDGEVLWSAAL